MIRRPELCFGFYKLQHSLLRAAAFRTAHVFCEDVLNWASPACFICAVVVQMWRLRTWSGNWQMPTSCWKWVDNTSDSWLVTMTPRLCRRPPPASVDLSSRAWLWHKWAPSLLFDLQHLFQTVVKFFFAHSSPCSPLSVVLLIFVFHLYLKVILLLWFCYLWFYY